MSKKDIHTNIMLDLETAGHPTLHNPAIIQIGAIHFDIDSGKELSVFGTYVNLQSCFDHKLATDESMLIWLEENIPVRKSQAKNAPPLPDVLRKLST